MSIILGNKACSVIIEPVRVETEANKAADPESNEPQAGAGSRQYLGDHPQVISWGSPAPIIPNRWENLDLSFLTMAQKRQLCHSLQTEALTDPDEQVPDQADEPDILVAGCRHMDKEWLLGFYQLELLTMFEHRYTPNPICSYIQFMDWYRMAMGLQTSPFYRASFMVSVSVIDWRKIRPKFYAVVKRHGYFLENLMINCPSIGVGDLAEILRAAPHITRLFLRCAFNPAKADDDSLPPMPYLNMLRLEFSNQLAAQKLLFAYGSQVQMLSFENATFFPALFQKPLGEFQYKNVTCLKVNAATAKLLKYFVVLNVFKLKSLSLKFVANGEELSKATLRILEFMEQSKETLEEIHLEMSPGAKHMNYYVDWNDLDRLGDLDRLDELVEVPCEKLVRFSINSTLICKEWLGYVLCKCPNLEQLRFFNFTAERQKVRDPLPTFVLPDILYEHYWKLYRNLSFISVMTKPIDDTEYVYFKSRKAAVKDVSQSSVIERYGSTYLPGLPAPTKPMMEVEDDCIIAPMFPIFLQMTDQEGNVLKTKTIAICHAGFVYPKQVTERPFGPSLLNEAAGGRARGESETSVATELVDWPLYDEDRVFVEEFNQPARKRPMRESTEETDQITEGMAQLSVNAEAEIGNEANPDENQDESKVENEPDVIPE